MRVTINGLTMGYDGSGVGTPILLLHAFPLARPMWRNQVEALAGLGRVLAVDLRGFGETSGFAGPPSVEQMADDVAALLDTACAREQAVLVGLSMGGYVALAFACKYPDRLRALVLADTRAEPDDEAGKAAREKMIAVAAEKGAAGVIDQMLPKMVSDETRKQRPQATEEIVAIATAQPTEGVINALKAMRDRPDARPGLGAIRVPTLVVVGEEDLITTPEVADRLAGGMPNARVVRVPGAGHLSAIERPDLFNHAVRDFLQGVH